MSRIFKFLNELNYEQLKESVNDMYWEYDRMSSSGQETLDKMADILKLPNFVERELVKKTENSIFIMFEQSGKKTPIDYMVAENGGISFFSNEKNIGDLGQKAKDGKITIEDLQGGTFTITNGGIYGSMLSTPILNPPQSAVLGMHNIIQRPVVVDGNVQVRPVMYLALSYDHRIIDGKEAVSFLKIVKESLEQPQRLFLNI